MGGIKLMMVHIGRSNRNKKDGSRTPDWFRQLTDAYAMAPAKVDRDGPGKSESSEPMQQSIVATASSSSQAGPMVSSSQAGLSSLADLYGVSVVCKSVKDIYGLSPGLDVVAVSSQDDPRDSDHSDSVSTVMISNDNSDSEAPLQMGSVDPPVYRVFHDYVNRTVVRLVV